MLEKRTDPVIDTSISEMLEMGVIREVTQLEASVFLSRVFTVPKWDRG